MPKFLFASFMMILLLTACTTPLFAPPTPTPTLTPTPSSTPTITPSLTVTETPSPTLTETPVPTNTLVLPITSVKDRAEFEELVEAGVIKCQGYEMDGALVLDHFINQAADEGILPKAKYMLGSGMPSMQDPSQCFFLMVFPDGENVLIYQDSETGKLVKLTMTE